MTGNINAPGRKLQEKTVTAEECARARVTYRRRAVFRDRAWHVNLEQNEFAKIL